MPLLPHLEGRRARGALLAAAIVAAAFGIIVSVLRSDYTAAAIIGVVAALLLLVWIWTGDEGDDERP